MDHPANCARPRVADKRILITAAAAGIGRAAALALAREGATVIATDIDEKGLASLAQAGLPNLSSARLDVLAADDVAASVNKFAPLDGLFNCAGVVHSGSILDYDEAAWTLGFNLNVRSMARMIHAHLPAMLAHGGGSIINMASVASSIKGVPGRCIYSASKAAVIGLTKSVAADFVGRGIRCNAICPATVDSPSLRQRISIQAAREGKTEDAVMAAFIARQPMGRIGRDEEIAALVVYLASDEAAYTTGAIHLVDGGMCM